MSGLIEKQTGNNVYLYLYKGIITQKVKSDTQGATQRENKKGDVVFEKQYTGIGGFVTKLTKESSDFDGITQYQWRITITIIDGDSKKNFILTIPEASRISGQFMNRLPNIDFAKEIELFTGEGLDKETGKPFQWISIKQDGEKIMPAFTKENPNGLPQLRQIKVKGQDVWDNSDQLAFYDKMVSETIIPKIKAASKDSESSIDELDAASTAYPSIDIKDVKTDPFGTFPGSSPAPKNGGVMPTETETDLPF